VAALRDQHKKYKDLPNPTARNRMLAKDADVSPSQIHRVINKKLGPSIDVIERIADALGVRPQDLLTPYFLRQPSDQEPPQADRELRRSRGT
jgi:transcriptional regulator with XRE-family HTH domain